MNLQTLGASLRRKLGPFPVWVWAIAGGVVLYFIRAKGYLGSGQQTADALQPSQADAREPQTQVPLQPGESVYDPNTGALSTAPGGDTSGDVQNDNTDTMLTAILAAVTKKKPKPKTKHKKPPKRKPKPKPAHHQKPGSTTKKPKPSHKKKPRSHTTIKWKPDRTPKPKHKPLTPMKPRTVKSVSANGARQRPTVPMVAHTGPTQHPVSTHGRRNPHPTQAAPRPSSPPPRHHRIPAKPSPAPKRPKPKKHH